MITEGSLTSNSEKAIRQIVASPEGKAAGLENMGTKGRIANKGKIDPSQFLDILKKVFPDAKISEFGPRQGPNQPDSKPIKGSSKYYMYQFDTEDGEVRILLAGGKNAGEQYEEDLYKAVKSSAGSSIDEIENKTVKQLFNYLKIDPTELKPEDVISTGKQDTKRSLSLDKVENIGSKISDITIKYKGKEYFISLKNISGSGFYNGGIVPFIVYDKDKKVIFDRSRYNDKPMIKNIFELFKIDPDKVAQGLNEYINKEGDIPNTYETVSGVDIKKLSNLIGSGYGYGYYYAREKSNGDLFMTSILTEKDLEKFIGTLSDVQVKYPNKEAKALYIKVSTNSEILGEINYIIAMRNITGSILPLTLKMTAGK
jgi:hypothetical protein